MKFNIGDKVRFLNQSGGGIVTKIISPKMVSVAIEEGFEIPTLTSELLLIQTQDSGSRFFSKSPETKPITNETQNPAAYHTTPKETEDEEEIDRLFSIRPGKPSESNTIWLAFIPHDQKWLITGLVDICLLNPTDYDLLFSFMIRQPDKQWRGVDYDVLPPLSGFTVATVLRDELENWLEGSVQMLFRNDLQPKLIMPASAAFNLKPARFLKEDNYIENSFLDEKALIINLASAGTTVSTPGQTEGADHTFESRIQTPKPKTLIDKHRTAPFEAEVDLHISALTDNYAGLSNHEILKIQTDYLQRCIESALEAQYRKVNFIHGIGNGTLRNAILEMLKQYEELTARNASFKKYGYGAIEVLNVKPE